MADTLLIWAFPELWKPSPAARPFIDASSGTRLRDMSIIGPSSVVTNYVPIKTWADKFSLFCKDYTLGQISYVKTLGI